MNERTWTLATAVTCARIAFLPVLWLWALEGRVRWVGIGVMASFLADILDGQLARRLHQVTRLGSRLDSIGDALLEVSAIVWLVWFRPEILEAPHRAAVWLGISTWVLIMAVGLLRFRRFLNLHLYSGKASGVAGALFAMDALVFGFHAPLFYLAFGVFTLANLEGLAVMLTRSHVDEHVGSILRRRPAELRLVTTVPLLDRRPHVSGVAPWFVVNPHAGSVRFGALQQAIRDRLAGREGIISCHLPDGDSTGQRLVVAVGGDGTVNRVINGCDPRRLRLGIIPRGSANDLGAELAIPTEFRRAWRVLEAGRYDEIDLVSVNASRFATCGGLGLATEVAARANGWKARAGWPGLVARRLGPLVYLLAALIEIRRRGRRPIEATIEANGATHRVQLSTLLVSNQARFGGFFSASPRASNRDGEVHLCGVRMPRNRARLSWVCAQLLRGRADRCPEVFELRARSVTVETGDDVSFFGDGEILAHGRRFRIDVLPRALKVATARADAGLEEAV